PFHRYFLLCSAGLAFYLLGKTAALLLTLFLPSAPPPALQIPSTTPAVVNLDIQSLRNANLFKTSVGSGTEKRPMTLTKSLCKNAQSESSLPIKLINTIVLQDSVKSIAAVQIRSQGDL